MNANIRNFVIIAHIDHGKSTLADRLLEVTGTIEKRRMKAQYLDQLELERERGITIKMAPVKMMYELKGEEYVLNLIDTPGHSDFHYEVSRALKAVEGAILLVDVSQGIQAQTIANFHVAQNAGLKIIGAINKIDLLEKNDPRFKIIINDLSVLLGINEKEILCVSGKTGEGVLKLLETIIFEVPLPKESKNEAQTQALVFDSFYDDHKGVVASIRMFHGELKNGKDIFLIGTGTHSKAKEIGCFFPELKSLGRGEKLKSGEIGYIATGIRDPAKIKIGDTLVAYERSKTQDLEKLALPGYKIPKPVVFVSFYPDNPDDYELLMRGLQKLKLNDSSLSIEPDQNEVLGRGFKVGFLGRLHFEITAERLKREFRVPTVNTFPSVIYKVKTANKNWITINKPEELPQDVLEIWEPMTEIIILMPSEYLKDMFSLARRYRIHNMATSAFQNRVEIKASMPLAELISDFDEQLKSMTSGFASFSYEIADYKKTDVIKVDVILANSLVPGLSRFIPKETLQREARKMVERLKELLPRQQFAQSIQAAAEGRIVVREDIRALRKDVTGYLYGGDRSRKMKLWQKQKRGKKLLKERARATIPPEVFKELLKK
ncbi:MAG: translation elongation factor 4 [Patescibacteria group bacterium]|nr:translation elongation factor 4 [Patescibacteria group bacterium]